MFKILKELEKLKQFSIESKLLGCEKYAQRLMKSDTLDLSIIATGDGVAPTELEIFSLFSIVFDTGSNTPLDTKTFSQIITEIRNYWHPKLNQAIADGDYADNFMMICGLTQFAVQGNIVQRLYRYDYFFHFINENINMPNVFECKFGSGFDDFEIFVFTVYLILSAKNVGNPTIPLSYIFKKYKNVMDVLTINTDSFIRELKGLYGDKFIDYFYGLKIQYLFPFIEATDGIYIPLPYLLINAATESLLNRLTEGNNTLRGAIGKNVIENYLFDIYSEIKSIRLISPEIDYKIGRQPWLSPDVIVVENDCCIMFDTKAITPSIKLREFSREKIEETALILGDNVSKIYKQIVNYLNGHFTIGYDIKKENIFGVVVVLEDCYISRKRIIECAISKLEQNGPIEETEKQYIYSNIKVISLREVESAVLQNTSYLPALISQRDEPNRWFDLSFCNPTVENGVIGSLDSFLEMLKSKYVMLIKEIDAE